MHPNLVNVWRTESKHIPQARFMRPSEGSKKESKKHTANSHHLSQSNLKTNEPKAHTSGLVEAALKEQTVQSTHTHRCF